MLGSVTDTICKPNGAVSPSLPIALSLVRSYYYGVYYLE